MYLILVHLQGSKADSKGQITSRELFGILGFFQKRTNKFVFSTGRKNEFVGFLEVGWKLGSDTWNFFTRNACNALIYSSKS